MTQPSQTEQKNRTYFYLAAGVVVLLSLFPLLSPAPYFLSMLYMVFLYVVLAESWNIIGGFTGYLSFGHVAFFGLGAYTTAFLMNKLAFPPWRRFYLRSREAWSPPPWRL